MFLVFDAVADWHRGSPGTQPPSPGAIRPGSLKSWPALRATRVSSETDGEIQVELRGEANDALDKTLIAVERWLGEAGIGSAKVWVGEQSYVVERPRVSRSPERRPARQIAKGSELSVLEGSQMKGSSKGARFIRRVNNSVYEVLVKLGIEDGEFWCECDDPGCEKRVVLTLREYAALRDRHGEPLLSRSPALPQVATVTDTAHV